MGRCNQEWPYVVHHLLESLAERAPTDASCALPLREGDLPDAGHHPVLLHHGVGDLGHLLQVILGSCTRETDAKLASSECERSASCTNTRSTSRESRGATGAHRGEHSTC